jgi:ferrous-iron efflux pump FieF
MTENNAENDAPFTPAADSDRLMRMATYAATATALILTVTKVVAWLFTDSVALLSSTLDSLLDGAASLVNLLAVRQALQPADDDHRFGHGKAEPLAGLAQAAFVAGSGILLVVHAGARFFTPVPVRDEFLGIAVMIFSIILTLALVTFQKYVIRHTRSVAISADSLHYTGDLLINGSVIVSLVLGMLFAIPWIDPLFAIGIAGFLLFNAWGIARDSMDLLMDREFPEDDRKKILDIAHRHKLVYDAHDLRTRSAGLQQFIQLHLEIDRNFPLYKAHAIADQVEREIRAAFPSADVIIHQDPAGVREPRHDDLAYEDRQHGTPSEE